MCRFFASVSTILIAIVLTVLIVEPNHIPSIDLLISYTDQHTGPNIWSGNLNDIGIENLENWHGKFKYVLGLQLNDIAENAAAGWIRQSNGVWIFRKSNDKLGNIIQAFGDGWFSHVGRAATEKWSIDIEMNHGEPCGILKDLLEITKINGTFFDSNMLVSVYWPAMCIHPRRGVISDWEPSQYLCNINTPDFEQKHWQAVLRIWPCPVGKFYASRYRPYTENRIGEPDVCWIPGAYD